MSTESFQNQFSRFYAEELKKSFRPASGDSFLLFFGRAIEWGSTFAGEPISGSDASPPINGNSISERYGAWRNAMGAKLIEESDVYHVFPRVDWVSNTVYDQYDSSLDMFADGRSFYVLTDEMNVYKCISNNGGSKSEQKPTNTGIEIFSIAADGYQWKFMFKVTEDSRRFLTLEYIPCQYVKSKEQNETRPQYDVQARAVNGPLEYIEMTGENSAYWSMCVPGGPEDTGAIISPVTENDWTIVKDLDSGPPQDFANITELDDFVNKFNNLGNSWVKIHRSALIGVGEVQSYNNYGLFINSGFGMGRVYKIAQESTSTIAVPDGFLIQLSSNLLSDLSFTESNNTRPLSKYTITPYAVVEGDGLDAAVRIKTTIQGQIEKIMVLSAGEDYTEARINILTDPSAGSRPEFKTFIGPPNGHGANPIHDFNASKIMIAVDILGEEGGDLISGPEFRQFGILKNPLISNGGKSAGGEYTNKIAGSEFSSSKYFELVKPYDIGFEWVWPAEDENVTFAVGDYIYGNESQAIAEIKSWRKKTNEDEAGLVGILEVSDVIGEFDVPTGKVDELRYVFADNTTGNEALIFIDDPVVQYGNTGDDGEADMINPSARGKVTKYEASNNELIIKLTSGSFGKTGDIWINETATAKQSFADGDNISLFENRGGELLKTFRVDSLNKITWRTGEGGDTQDIARARNQTDYVDLYERIPTYNLAHRCIINHIGHDVNPLTVASFTPGEHMKQTRADFENMTATVAKWSYTAEGSTGELVLTNVFNEPEIGTQSLHTTSAATPKYTITSIEVPELKKGSGELLYIQNIRPVIRTFEQQEEFKVLLGF